MMNDLSLCCNWCKRLYDFHLGEYDRVIAHCEAYPNGIPESVFYAGHFYPKPGDNGLQFDYKDTDLVGIIEKKSQEEENESYERIKKEEEELDMTDEEWLKMRHQKNDEMAKLPDELLLPFRSRRENQPKIW